MIQASFLKLNEPNQYKIKLNKPSIFTVSDFPVRILNDWHDSGDFGKSPVASPTINVLFFWGYSILIEE